MKTEVWKPAVGYEGRYEVSNTGRARAVWTDLTHPCAPRILKQATNHSGYKFVGMSAMAKGKRMNQVIHRLVAETFIPNRAKLPVVHHKNAIKCDNSVTNLEWVTDAQNKMYALAAGRYSSRENHPNAKLSSVQVARIRKLKGGENTRKQIAKEYGISTSTIDRIWSGRNWFLFSNTGQWIMREFAFQYGDGI